MSPDEPLGGWTTLPAVPPPGDDFWTEVRAGLDGVRPEDVPDERALDVAESGGEASPRSRRVRVLAGSIAAVVVVLAVVAVASVIGRDPDTIGPAPADSVPATSAPPAPTAAPVPTPSGVPATSLAASAAELPDGTTELRFVDVAAMRTAEGVDPSDLAASAAEASPLPIDGPSIVELAIVQALPPPSELTGDAHREIIDLREIDLVLTAQPGFVTVIVTRQDPDELATAYEAAGFEPLGDGRFVDRGTLGTASAVRIEPGRLVMASEQNLDFITGASDEIRALLDAADGARAGSVSAPDVDPSSPTCELPLAMVAYDTDFELLLLDGGADLLDPDWLRTNFARYPEPLTELDDGRPDGEITRYRYEPSDVLQVLGSSAILWTERAPDAPPLAACPT